MFEKNLYLLYLPQVAELIVICQQMDCESYEQWKQETRGTIPNKAIGFMEKIFAVVDKYSGHQVSA